MQSDVTKMRIRATPEARALVFGAAERRGVSVSKFVVRAAVEHANRILDIQEDSAAPAELNAKLFAAFDKADRKKRRGKLLETAEDSGNGALPAADITSPPHAA